jgi:16S rRNA G527 N7-methylase RsmG
MAQIYLIIVISSVKYTTQTQDFNIYIIILNEYNFRYNLIATDYSSIMRMKSMMSMKASS